MGAKIGELIFYWLHPVRLTIIVAICLSPAANAVESWHTSTIRWIYPQASGDFIVVFDTNAPDCPNTNTSNKYHYVVVNQNGMTEEGAKKIYAAAMMALAMDKTVYAVFDNATASCYINRLVVMK